MGWFLPLLAALSLQVEHARTPEEIQLGLMGREVVEEGMLFHFSTLERRSFWMMGVHVDLDLAFLDEEGIVLEVHRLKAYPAMMDPQRPVRVLDDLKQYPLNDPVRRFFGRRAVRSKARVAYALEMPAGWLAEHGVGPGTQITLN